MVSVKKKHNMQRENMHVFKPQYFVIISKDDAMGVQQL